MFRPTHDSSKMAETLKTSDKVSTSSDLGSSCGNDVDLSCDANRNLDDAVSAEGSVSLTIDSLEDEDPKDQQCFEESTTTIKQSEMLNSGDSKDSLYADEEKEHSKIETCKNKYKLSELAVHSEQKGREEDNHVDSEKAIEKDLESGGSPSVEIEERTLNENNCDSDTKLLSAKDQGSDQESVQNVLTEHCTTDDTATAQQNSETCQADENINVTANTCDEISEETCVTSKEEHDDDKLILRKTRSLTDESSTDPSPKHSRRSGIPRRKSSTHSMITVLSMDRPTPQSSPVRTHRSHTINSEILTDRPSSAMPGASPCRNPASFPQSPVKVSELRRSASQSEFSISCVSSVSSRDTLTSRLRFEKHHQDHDRARLDESYMTPSQRKDLIMKELKAQIKQLTKQMEQKEREIEDIQRATEEEKEQIRKNLQEELENARQLAETARREVSSLQESHTEAVKKVASLQQQLEAVKKEMMGKLAESEEIFLEMYNKGRESAIFEHEEEVELQRKGGRSAEATEKELYDKLVRTQAELAKWQTIQRHESYHTMPVPGTEAETTLRFLKDAVFHFLTTDRKTSDEHLRAIVRILRFSEVQKEKIAHAIIMKRNKTGW